MSYAGEVAAILDDYGRDPEGAHGDEDALLARFVRLRASQGDRTAQTLLQLLDAERRRWYA